MREVKPFYWFLVAGLILQYGFTIHIFASAWGFGRLAIFTTLMILHGIIHWFSSHLTYKTILTPFYFIIQCGLAMALVLISGSYALTYGLFAPLLGELLGMFRHSKHAITFTIVILASSFISYVIARDMLQIWEWIVTAIPISVFVWLYVSLFTRQVMARERAQELFEELETAHSQLAEYADQVEGLTRNAERQRMARELHDTLAQGLAGLILQLEATDSHLSGGHTEKAQNIVQQAMTRARTTLADARLAIDDLRQAPSTANEMLEDIQEEVERFERTTNISCALNICHPGEVDPQLAENVVRTISEGLMNIAKHAQASQAAVDLTCSEHNLQVQLRDNGVGFDAQKAIGQSGHYGLLGMRERARNLGGSLVIESDSARGTTLKLELPLAGKDDR